MKDFRNYLIAILLSLLLFSVFVNVKVISHAGRPTPYHEEATIAFQTCMNLYTNQPASLSNSFDGWARANTKKAILECADYANDMNKKK
jgi:lipid II:glycine glycyltransferase (peptidoglycan interpeptide bridge formation enzyme)